MQLQLDIHPELAELRQALGKLPAEHEDAKLVQEVIDYCVFRHTDIFARRHIAVLFCRVMRREPRPAYHTPYGLTSRIMLHKVLAMDRAHTSHPTADSRSPSAGSLFSQ